MAGCIIFLPGILGSRLTLHGEEIWPPSIAEISGGYERIDKLTDDRVVAGAPIGKVCLMSVYQPLLDDLADIASGKNGAPERSFHAFGYDWRIDLREIARDIAARIDALPVSDLEEVHFVGHSMGALVLRLILESDEHSGHVWYGRIRTFTALAGPHRGAPSALVKAMGLEGSTGLSGAHIRQMAADPRYPSLYQLLPHPGVSAVWNVRGGRARSMDIFSGAGSRRFGLDAGNLRKAVMTAKIFAAGRKPQHVDYLYLAASGHDTCARVEISAGISRMVEGDDTGDGTVPLWSAIDPVVMHHVVPGAHDSFFRDDRIRWLLYRALGARLPGRSYLRGGERPGVSLQAGSLVYGSGSAPGLVMVTGNRGVAPEGYIVVDFSSNPSTHPFLPMARLKVAFAKVKAGYRTMQLPPLHQAGFYRVQFFDAHDTAHGDAIVFAVSCNSAGPVL